MTQLRLVACERRRPMIKPLVISREVFVEEITIEVSISDGPLVGRGEGCPALRFGETAAGAENACAVLAGRVPETLSAQRSLRKRG